MSTFCSSFSVSSRLMPGNLLRSSTVVDDDVSISRSGPCRLMPGIPRMRDPSRLMPANLLRSSTVVDDDVSISRSGPCRLMPGISRNARSLTVVDVSTFCSSFSVPSRLMLENLLRSTMCQYLGVVLADWCLGFHVTRVRQQWLTTMLPRSYTHFSGPT